MRMPVAATVTCITLGLLWQIASAEAATDPKKILDAVDDLHRGSSAEGKMTMKVRTANWSRELVMEFWSKGEERSLLRILSPKKEKGTTTLKVENNIWNYLPKIKRVIKVPSSMMGGSWMGSHFTNDDLIKDNRMADEFSYAVTFEGQRDGQQVIEITCTPNPDAPVVWGKVVVEVSSDHLPTRIRYFDEDGLLARTMTFSNVATMGGRRIPTVMRVVPANKPDEYTEVRYDDMRYDVPLSDDLFTLRSLRR